VTGRPQKHEIKFKILKTEADKYIFVLFIYVFIYTGSYYYITTIVAYYLQMCLNKPHKCNCPTIFLRNKKHGIFLGGGEGTTTLHNKERQGPQERKK